MAPHCLGVLGVNYAPLHLADRLGNLRFRQRQRRYATA